MLKAVAVCAMARMRWTFSERSTMNKFIHFQSEHHISQDGINSFVFLTSVLGFFVYLVALISPSFDSLFLAWRSSRR